jgi:hypothetical protein
MRKRSRHRWQDNIKWILKGMEWEDVHWLHLTGELVLGFYEHGN